MLVDFGSLVEIVSERKPADLSEIDNYVSTDTMLRNFGGVQKATTMPATGNVTVYHPSEILFSNIRTYFRKVWKANCLGTCSNDVLVFRSRDTRKLLNHFLFHVCRSDVFIEFTVQTSKGAKMPRGDKEAIKGFQFPLPSIKVQKEISAVLGSLDEKIEVNRRMNETLEAMARALFKDWFVDFGPTRAKMQHREPYLTREIWDLFPDTLDASAIPTGWGTKLLGNIVTPKKGKTITKKQCFEGKIPVVAGGLEPAYFHNQSNVTAPVVTISASGANAGYVNLYHQDIWASDCSYISKEQSNTIYFWYLFLKYNQSHIFHMQQGAAQPHVYPSDLARLSLSYPQNMNLLNAFDELVTPIFERIKVSNEESRTLAQTRDLLLPKLMSGEIRVADAKTTRKEKT